MKRTILCLTIAALTTTGAFAQNSVPSFHSDNKPLEPSMAEPSEMKAYKADFDRYVSTIDAEIARLKAKKAEAAKAYNDVVYEYNKDQFFHQGTFPYYKHRVYCPTGQHVKGHFDEKTGTYSYDEYYYTNDRDGVNDCDCRYRIPRPKPVKQSTEATNTSAKKNPFGWMDDFMKNA